ncbi:MAG: myo-inosose-2 dehydratase [Anaerovoracaceae bacterium]
MLDSSKIRLGIAPINWTNDDLPELGKENTFEQCISEMALAGYAGSEVGNKYPKSVPELKAALELRDMEICNAWFGSCFTTKPMEEVVEEFIAHRDFLYSMGAKVIGGAEVGNSLQSTNLPVIDAKPDFTEEEWTKVLQGTAALGRLAKERGMKYAYHHHMGTGIQTPEEIDRLMDYVGEDAYLLFDTGHLYYSEDDIDVCIAVLKKYIDRVAHIHLKDVRDGIVESVRKNKLSFLDGVKLGTFTVPGDGDIDFTPFFDIIAASEYEGWMVVEAEQDPAKANPLQYAKIARKYINEKTGL